MPDRILIVDDEQPIRMLYQQVLAAEGYSVDVAANGREALALIAPAKYSAVVLDIEMPELSGMELMHQFREVAPNTAIILNTAYPSYKADFQTWLADAYIVKSSDLQPLLDKLKELVAPL